MNFAEAKPQTTLPDNWSVAVFAYNEAKNILSTLESIVLATADHPISITVLVNGCKDATSNIVNDFAKTSPNIRLIDIELADKANAWNHYVHEAINDEQCTDNNIHFFLDGDVRVERKAFHALMMALKEYPSANAAGAMPMTGRDRDAWRERMVCNGTIAGCLYALPGHFLKQIRERQILMPKGFIGEDWLVSYLAGSNLGKPLFDDQSPLIVFAVEAGFSFRSLSPWLPKDYIIYIRRLWRYTLRQIQYEMLISLLHGESIKAIPSTVEELYRSNLFPSRLKWIGRMSVIRFIAIQYVRTNRKKG